VGESPEAKVRSGSKRTLSSYHETHKGTGLKPLGSQPGSEQNPESVREYLHEMLISHEHTYKRDNIYTTVEWRSPEAERARRPGESPKAEGLGGQVGSPEANDHEGSTTHGISSKNSTSQAWYIYKK